MGRIKTQLIKRTARKLFTKYPGQAKVNFDENKGMVTNLLQNPNKKMRNIIAGYLARLTKQLTETAKPRRRSSLQRLPRAERPSRQR